MGTLDIQPASEEDEIVFRNLWQFYIYEYSYYMGFNVTYAGRFTENDLDECWSNSYRHPFLFRLEGKLAGLAIVNHLEESHITGAKNVVEMSEFFIMGAYQGKGHGAHAATYLFNLYRGDWEVFQLTENIKAQAFWRKVIGRYTNSNYREQPARRGIVQLFSNR